MDITTYPFTNYELWEETGYPPKSRWALPGGPTEYVEQYCDPWVAYLAEEESKRRRKEREAVRDAELAKLWDQRAAEERARALKRQGRKRRRHLPTSNTGNSHTFGSSVAPAPLEVTESWKRRVRTKHATDVTEEGGANSERSWGKELVREGKDPYARLFRKWQPQAPIRS